MARADPRPPVRAVLFDLDGTLYDVEQYHRGAFAAIGRGFAAYGEPEDLAEALLDLWRRRKSRRPGLLDAFAGSRGIPRDEIPRMLAIYRGHDPRHLDPYPDAVEALARLEGPAVGLVTNGHAPMQRRKVRALGLARRLRPAVFAGEDPRERPKPAPDAFLRALDALGLPAAEVAFVGDDPEIDMPAPISIGMRAIRLRRGEYVDERTPEGAVEVRDLREVPRLLGIEGGP